MTRASVAWRLRLAALVCVAAFALVVRASAPDPGARRAWLLLAALGLGYGHQLGALCFAGRRRRAPLELALWATTAASVGVAFALALASAVAPGLIVGLALLAAWHVLENDRALGGVAGDGSRLPPLPRALRPHLAAIAAAAGVVAAAWYAPRLAPFAVAAGAPVWLAAWTPEEVIAALLLYHSLVWVGRTLASTATVRPRATARRSAILLLHVLPCLALLGARELAPGLFLWAVAPPVYLLLSASHALHTCALRGLEPA